MSNRTSHRRNAARNAKHVAAALNIGNALDIGPLFRPVAAEVIASAAALTPPLFPLFNKREREALVTDTPASEAFRSCFE